MTNGAVDVSAPRRLFVAPSLMDWQTVRNVYDVVPDGNKFLVTVDDTPSAVAVVLNWSALLKP
jgi:hypothetical protein